jgi:hypothetical protein
VTPAPDASAIGQHLGPTHVEPAPGSGVSSAHAHGQAREGRASLPPTLLPGTLRFQGAAAPLLIPTLNEPLRSSFRAPLACAHGSSRRLRHGGRDWTPGNWIVWLALQVMRETQDGRRTHQGRPAAIRLAKGALNAIEDMSLRHEQDLTAQLSEHPEAEEAAAAFREKRKARVPQLKGGATALYPNASGASAKVPLPTA